MPGAAYCTPGLRGCRLAGADRRALRRSGRHGVLDDLLADLLAGLLGLLDVARGGLLAEIVEVALRARGEGRGGIDARLAGIDRLLDCGAGRATACCATARNVGRLGGGRHGVAARV